MAEMNRKVREDADRVSHRIIEANKRTPEQSWFGP
jgi:hypothetical protein